MEEHYFDSLAKEVADGAISRGQALKVAGAAFLGMLGLAGLPTQAEAKKKKKKKKKHKRRPRICTASDCSQCGPSPKTGNSCRCTPDIFGNPVCTDVLKGGFPTCTTNSDCPLGSICIEAFACGAPPGTFLCAFPCGS